MTFEKKICTQTTLVERLAELPHPWVLTNGVFDILHKGHVSYLEKARSCGQILVVAVNEDESVKCLGKGKDRPVNACSDRMAVLAALESVSLVVPFSGDTALQVVQCMRPDIYVKGADYDLAAIPEGRAVLDYGGKLFSVTFEHDCSTTKLLSKIRGNVP